ncbi:unnamed protein product [Vitrella brassicaformis CCMP3155]|uniref:Uncharacterized protein n=1 Tax=Vitrella brassicaformis (strain CCMP3155) TaxID=1169540 RepID=A0A0G4FZ91_VITBC|nr:unnamed protein product [Vitrella brassicaformis CCMP3155]|eukprot:CEM20838.1 unnamed protein product [Vitrella brassicaformis CCMP3155]
MNHSRCAVSALFACLACPAYRRRGFHRTRRLLGLPVQEEGEQQHPFTYIFRGRRTCFLLSHKDILRLRSTCEWLRHLFGAGELRTRLANSLARDGDGVNSRLQLVQFDQSLPTAELLAAVWIAEHGGRWDEVREVLQLASQFGYCTLPVNITADDIRTHANKTAYSSIARVLAQLIMVGRHVDFGNGSCMQLFRHGEEVRAVRDEPNFLVEVDPPLPAGHLYQQHRLQHDPPVRSGIERWWRDWSVSGCLETYASLSSFVKSTIILHYEETCDEDPDGTLTDLKRYVGGGRLHDLFTQSPHTPVEGCTTTATRTTIRRALRPPYQEISVNTRRQLVLTDSSHSFVAWITIWANDPSHADNVNIVLDTTEACVGDDSGDCKDYLPLTTALARVALGPVAPFVFDG